LTEAEPLVKRTTEAQPLVKSGKPDDYRFLIGAVERHSLARASDFKSMDLKSPGRRQAKRSLRRVMYITTSSTSLVASGRKEKHKK
jgi:hypothetical protein